MPARWRTTGADPSVHSAFGVADWTPAEGVLPSKEAGSRLQGGALMRTALAQLHVPHPHVPHHEPTWWLSHSLVAVAAAALMIYGAAVLLVLTGVLLFS
jgi:hypothetical protein